MKSRVPGSHNSRVRRSPSGLGAVVAILTLAGCANSESLGSQMARVPGAPAWPPAEEDIQAVFAAATLPGYRLEQDVEAEARAGDMFGNPLVQRYLAGFGLRQITRNGTVVGSIVVMRFTPDLPAAERPGFIRGFSERAEAKPKEIALGNKKGTLVEAQGLFFVAHVATRFFVVVGGPDEDEAVRIATAAIAPF